MKKQITRVDIGRAACLVLMLMLLVLQFTPFWTYGEAGEKASISQYIWFPSQYTGVDAMLSAALGGNYAINQIVLGPVLLLACCAAGSVLCVMKSGRGLAAVVAALAGLTGVISYAGHAAMRMGMGWGFHLVLCILLLLCGVITAYWQLIEK